MNTAHDHIINCSTAADTRKVLRPKKVAQSEQFYIRLFKPEFVVSFAMVKTCSSQRSHQVQNVHRPFCLCYSRSLSLHCSTNHSAVDQHRLMGSRLDAWRDDLI